jgi:hypothetical protein
MRCNDVLQRFSFGAFHVGPANPQTIEYRSKRAGSPDFFDRYSHKISDRLTFERDITHCRCFGIPTLRTESISFVRADAARSRMWQRCVTGYFQILALSYWKDFWAAFVEEQELLIAAGAPAMDERIIQTVYPTHMISIFQNIDGEGFVAPLGSGPIWVELAKADQRIPATLAMLRETYDFTKWQDTELHHTLRSFSRFFAKAKRHEVDGGTDEAFLHYVIALDLLFGEKESLTASVSKRAAMVIFRELNLSPLDALKHVQALYDARSQYVHKGRSPRTESLFAVAGVCSKVLHVLLRLQKNRRDISVSNWLKQLDYLYASIEAARTVSTRDLQECGIVDATNDA